MMAEDMEKDWVQCGGPLGGEMIHVWKPCNEETELCSVASSEVYKEWM